MTGLFSAVFLRYERLDDADGANVFLDRSVHRVVTAEAPAEVRHDLEHYQEQRRAHQRHCREIAQRYFPVKAESHREREYQHQRSTYRAADNHLIGVLDVGDVRGHSGNQRRHRKTVYFPEGKILYGIEHVLSEVGGKSGSRPCGITRGKHARNQRRHRHRKQYRAVFQHGIHTVCEFVDKLRHYHGNNRFHHHFHHDKYRGEHGRRLIFPYTLSDSFQNVHISPATRLK